MGDVRVILSTGGGGVHPMTRLPGGELDAVRISLSEYIRQRVQALENPFSYAAFPPVVTVDGRKVEQVEDSYTNLAAYAYRGDSVVAACMRVRRDLFRQAKFTWRELGESGPGKIFRTDDLALLERPWPNGTTGELLTRMITDVDLCGNSFIVNEGERLRWLRPDWVSIILSGDPLADEQIDVVGYIYTPGGGFSGDNGIPYKPDEVCHWSPEQDPLAFYRGMSWVSKAIEEIQGDRAATTHKLAFFRNGATLGPIIRTPQGVTLDQFKEFVAAAELAHAGAANAYKTMYVGGGAEVTLAAADFRQLDLKAVQGGMETRIAAVAGVHPVLVGLSEGLSGSSLNAGNFAAARRATAEMTLFSLWQDVCGALTAFFDPPDGAELWIRERDIPFLREERKDQVMITKEQILAIEAGVRAGVQFDPLVDAVAADDITLLKGKHSGLFSVQLQPPGSEDSAEGTDEETAEYESALESFRADFGGEVRRDRYNVRNPKGTVGGGRFRKLSDVIKALLEEWDGTGDPFRDEHGKALFTQPQLKKAAEQLGIDVPPRSSAPKLQTLLLKHSRGDLEQQARDVHASADAKRKVADLLAEVDELTASGASSRALKNRINAVAKVSGAPDDVRDDLLAAADDPDGLPAAVDRLAKAAGLERVGEAGAVTKFNRGEHDSISGDMPNGSPVRVLRPGYAAEVDGERVVLSRPKVIEADEADLFSGGNKFSGAGAPTGVDPVAKSVADALQAGEITAAEAGRLLSSGRAPDVAKPTKTKPSTPDVSSTLASLRESVDIPDGKYGDRVREELDGLDLENARQRAANLRAVSKSYRGHAGITLANSQLGSPQARRAEQQIAAADAADNLASALERLTGGPDATGDRAPDYDVEALVDEAGLRGRTASQLKRIAEELNVTIPKGVTSATARRRYLIESLVQSEKRRTPGAVDSAVRRLRDAAASLDGRAGVPEWVPETVGQIREMDAESMRDRLDTLGALDLKSISKHLGLKTSGRKQDLVDRIVERLSAPDSPGRGGDTAAMASLRKRLDTLAEEAVPIADEIAKRLESSKVYSHNENVDFRRRQARLRQLVDEGSTAARELLDSLTRRDGEPWGGDPDADADRWRSVGPSGTFTNRGTLSADEFGKIRDRYVITDRNTVTQNASLRSDNPTPAALSWAKRMSKMVQSYELAHDTKLYRGAALRPDQIAQLRPGAVTVDRGMMSTATDISEAEQYADTRLERMPGTIKTMFEIRAPRGTPAASVGSGEVVLDRDSRLRIVSSRFDGGVVHVVMEMLGTAERPSGLPAKPTAADFEDLADRISVLPRTGKEQRVYEILQDLNASELARLARKFPGSGILVPGWLKSSDRRRGLRLPDGLSLDEKRRWLARQLSVEKYFWR